MADKKISQLTGATTPLGGTEEVPLVQSSTTKKVTVANLTAGRSVAAASFQSNGRIVYGATAIYDVPGPTGNNTGLSFSGNLYLPVDGTGTLTNGVVSIGSSSYRYNDIHIAGNVIPGTAAKGVNFTANTPAAGMTSQLLNWYEEGTWTPAIAFATNGDLAVTYSDQVGRYTRIGRQVTVSFWIATSSFTHTTASGVMRITGAPFNAANTYQHTAAVSVLQGVTKANYTAFGFYANAGSKDLTSAASGSGQGFDNITAANMPSGGTVYIACTLTYFV